jgi:hypothetical protein
MGRCQGCCMRPVSRLCLDFSQASHKPNHSMWVEHVLLSDGLAPMALSYRIDRLVTADCRYRTSPEQDPALRGLPGTRPVDLRCRKPFVDLSAGLSNGNLDPVFQDLPGTHTVTSDATTEAQNLKTRRYPRQGLASPSPLPSFALVMFRHISQIYRESDLTTESFSLIRYCNYTN